MSSLASFPSCVGESLGTRLVMNDISGIMQYVVTTHCTHTQTDRQIHRRTDTYSHRRRQADRQTHTLLPWRSVLNHVGQIKRHFDQQGCMQLIFYTIHKKLELQRKNDPKTPHLSTSLHPPYPPTMHSVHSTLVNESPPTTSTHHAQCTLHVTLAQVHTLYAQCSK